MSNKKEDMEKVTDTAETSKKSASGFGKKLKYGSMSAVVMVFVIASIWTMVHVLPYMGIQSRNVS